MPSSEDIQTNYSLIEGYQANNGSDFLKNRNLSVLLFKISSSYMVTKKVIESASETDDEPEPVKETKKPEVKKEVSTCTCTSCSCTCTIFMPPDCGSCSCR